MAVMIQMLNITYTWFYDIVTTLQNTNCSLSYCLLHGVYVWNNIRTGVNIRL